MVLTGREVERGGPNPLWLDESPMIPLFAPRYTALPRIEGEFRDTPNSPNPNSAMGADDLGGESSRVSLGESYDMHSMATLFAFA